MDVLESIIFGFVTIFGSLLLLVLVFNCLQMSFDNLRSQSIVKKLTAKLRALSAKWRPGNRSTQRALKRLKNLPFLRFKGQHSHLSFHFEVIGTPWIVIIHDDPHGQRPEMTFIDTSRSEERRVGKECRL